jgi:CHAT domain-containing protein
MDRDSGAGKSSSALIVTNPTGDLASAVHEGDVVARALGGWQITRLDKSLASRDVVLRLLPGVALFHYAGHALVEGPSGSGNSLVLADGARADLGDLLALQRLPGVVVLAACQTAAAAATGSRRSGMGLAQAFLAAGSRFVVAPVENVGDAETEAFFATFYGQLTGRGVDALGTAFQRAAIAALGKSSESFRLIVR